MKTKIKFIVSIVLSVLTTFLELVMKTEATLLNYCVISVVNITIGFSIVYYYHQLILEKKK